jgi:hypothetical protein
MLKVYSAVNDMTAACQQRGYVKSKKQIHKVHIKHFSRGGEDVVRHQHIALQKVH